MSQWEIPEPWEFAEGLERWEETLEKRHRNNEYDWAEHWEQRGLEPWEREE